jgi:hypothetical protein
MHLNPSSGLATFIRKALTYATTTGPATFENVFPDLLGRRNGRNRSLARRRRIPAVPLECSN